ncbi:MAG: c-type cytochrome biogenesis protein CcsB [Nitrospirae bacterium]|nr:c-type cytochrome biogenesis protein CcsB [Nitrospirota bacterium]
MGTILFELALTFYFAATVLSVVDFFKGAAGSSRLMISATSGGFVIHTAAIVYRLFSAGYLPIASMHDASSFFAWCIVLIFLLLELRYKIGIVGSFILPIVFILMLSSSVLPRGIPPLSPQFQSYWFGIHTFIAFLGNAAFAVAFGVGIMYLMQEHNLKSKRLKGLFKKLPSLQVLDEINYKMIALGFPLLTITIITGALWSENIWGAYWRWDPKEVWSLITWLIYAAIIHIRITAGWRGRRSAVLSILGFMAALFTFFGVNLLMKSFHSLS